MGNLSAEQFSQHYKSLSLTVVVSQQFTTLKKLFIIFALNQKRKDILAQHPKRKDFLAPLLCSLWHSTLITQHTLSASGCRLPALCPVLPLPLLHLKLYLLHLSFYLQ
jgi:hypothetical protein